MSSSQQTKTTQPQQDRDDDDAVIIEGRQESRPPTAQSNYDTFAGSNAGIGDDDADATLTTTAARSNAVPDSATTGSGNGGSRNLCCCLWYSCWFPAYWFCGCAGGCGTREAELASLPSGRRTDYITKQPFVSYYGNIYAAKYNIETEAAASRRLVLPPLSRLSKGIVVVLLLVLGALLTLSLAGDVPSFGILDYAVFVATWIHAIGLLAILAWFCNAHISSRLSLDAIVKFFASGFVLSVSYSLIWELVFIVVLAFAVAVFVPPDVAGGESGTINGTSSPFRGDLDEEVWFVATHPFRGLTSTLRGDIGDTEPQVPGIARFAKDNPVLCVLLLAIQAFVVAGFVEEMCKYVGYRAVEHPDFLSKQMLQEEERRRCVDDGGGGRRHQKVDYARQNESMQARGAAITLAMVSVALGFTCSENLFYVFNAGGSSPRDEWSILCARALLPVHALAAAIQSIGVCRRDLEMNTKTNLFWILFPAIAFHGGFDFFLFLMSFVAYAAKDDPTGGGAQKGIAYCALLWLATGIVAIWGYCVGARRQRERLAAMDRRAEGERLHLLV